MVAKLTTPTHEIAIQLRLVAESSTTCSSRSGRPVRKLLDTPSYMQECLKVTEVENYSLIGNVKYKNEEALHGVT